MNLSVEVISDVICPWCFIGKRRLEKAVGDYEKPVTVRWHPFQLNPAMPKEGISRREYRIGKFGSWERSMQLDANIIAVGKEEGIHFDFDRMERTPNTSDAHRLIWLADKEGIQDAVVEALFLAYFTDGRDTSNQKTLIEVVAEASIDRKRLRCRFPDKRRPYLSMGSTRQEKNMGPKFCVSHVALPHRKRYRTIVVASTSCCLEKLYDNCICRCRRRNSALKPIRTFIQLF